MNEERTMAESSPNEAKPSPWEWMLGIITDPKGTFQAIEANLRRPHPTDPAKTTDRTRWWIPVVMAAVVGAVVAVYTVPNIVMPMQEDTIRESVLERGGTMEQAEEAIDMSSTIGVPAGIIGAAAQVFVMLFIIAGVLHLIVKMLGGKGGFRGARAIVAYAMVISGIIAPLVKLPIMVARQTIFVETGPTVLPFFRDLEPSDTLYKFLFSGFDIFSLWWYVVIAVGVAVCYRVKAGKAAAASIIIWAAMTALFTFTNLGGYGG
ncbi:MAG: hypothetical protein GF405_08245 [Candidatus Eisenbacteria bacterium]|nr:hypothetical protein [Candidatus Eisenbacteria bacterium]